MLYIFDKDGTLIESLGNRPANTVFEQRLRPGVAEKIAELKEQGHQVAIASNQGGVAKGYISFLDAMTLMIHVAAMLNVDDAVFCPHHPEGLLVAWSVECGCRKPKPGMIRALMNSFGLTPEETIFVGDWDTDRQAAEAAEVKFIWAHEFFGWEQDQ